MTVRSASGASRPPTAAEPEAPPLGVLRAAAGAGRHGAECNAGPRCYNPSLRKPAGHARIPDKGGAVARGRGSVGPVRLRRTFAQGACRGGAGGGGGGGT